MWLMQVSRANAIIAELLRLSDYIPPLFKVTHEERVRADPCLESFPALPPTSSARIAQLFGADPSAWSNHPPPPPPRLARAPGCSRPWYG